MEPSRIKDAENEAVRFLNRLKQYEYRVRTDDDAAMRASVGMGFKESGALRRASLDLSRALSLMRKP